MSIFRNGAGRIYYSAQLQYSPLKPRTEPVNAGVELRREYSVRRNGRWQIIHSPLKVSQGELVRRDLDVSIPSRRNFLVVDDPVPGALETVNTDLATASKVDAATGITLSEGAYWYRRLDWIDYASTRWSFYHRELRNDSARFYSDYLAPGNYHLAYTAQAIAAGEFTAAPSHAEELYDPDVFGKSAAAVIEVERLKN